MSESPSNCLQALAGEIAGEVRLSSHDRMLYATDASMYQVEPLGVVIPASIEDAAIAARWCLDRKIPVLARGGGTSLAGQCTNRAVVIDVSVRCRDVLEIDAENRRCRVEAGITLDALNQEIVRATDVGLFFAPDPASGAQCCIGGMIGNNAAGARSVRYGRTSEHVLGVDALLASGERVLFEGASSDPRVREINQRVMDVVRRYETPIRERFPKTLRRNAGYALDGVLGQLDLMGDLASEQERAAGINLSGLLCGSEGTLAITLGATLRLTPVPTARTLAVIGYGSIESAIGSVEAILTLHPSAVELIDDTVLGLARGNLACRAIAEELGAGDPEVGALLYVEFQSERGHDEIDEALARMRSICGSDRVMVLGDSVTAARAWALRKAGEPLLHAVRGDRKPVSFVEDCAIPVDRLPEFVRRMRGIVEDAGTTAAYWAHASVGVLHVRPLVDPRDAGDRERMVEMSTRVCDLAMELGGVMSGEHGDGRARGPFLERYFGAELVRAFGEVKSIVDPHSLLNPGNIVEAGGPDSIVTRMRVMPERVGRGPEVLARRPDVKTYFDFGDEGFLGGAEACNGAGFCRKRSGGAMCPSYRATSDERHATRGRANALRLAISGQIGEGLNDSREPVFDDPDTLETLSLCLGCKACKAECPTNVDVAKLKSEYLAQSYRQRGGAPWSVRAIGAIDRLHRVGALAPRLANLMGSAAPSRWLLHRALGIDPRRSVPKLCKPLPRQWAKGHANPDGARVVLLSDTFTTYTEPHIALAARRLLEAFGYRVELFLGDDFGRARISLGLLEGAIRSIDRTLDRLGPMIEDESIAAFLIIEPSCLSAVRDDWLELRVRTAREIRERLAARSYLVEQFLDEYWDTHPQRAEFGEISGRLLLHAHCHQTALWGAESSAALLRRIWPDRVDVLDAGCCGMGGAFGYTHYDVSMAVGELALLPACRAALPNDIICASGTSCRHQIQNGISRDARHSVEVLDVHLA